MVYITPRGSKGTMSQPKQIVMVYITPRGSKGTMSQPKQIVMVYITPRGSKGTVSQPKQIVMVFKSHIEDNHVQYHSQSFYLLGPVIEMVKGIFKLNDRTKLANPLLIFYLSTYHYLRRINTLHRCVCIIIKPHECGF
jgi:hypothetical protein